MDALIEHSHRFHSKVPAVIEIRPATDAQGNYTNQFEIIMPVDAKHQGVFSMPVYGTRIEVSMDYQQTLIWHEGATPWAHVERKPQKVVCL